MTKYVYVQKGPNLILGYVASYYNQHLKAKEDPEQEGYVLLTDNIEDFPALGMIVRAYGYNPEGVIDSARADYPSRGAFELWSRNKKGEWVFINNTSSFSNTKPYFEYVIVEQPLNSLPLVEEEALEIINQPKDVSDATYVRTLADIHNEGLNID